ncbi:MAG: hypothetical protein CFH37_01427 [Alphaproteobacteria bacterium MarineAlpha9_Bin7]|nr:MAG: hypothetical protein CFH37_01427 [Alphaproteobacteria bacterium MarineAlpha9_Bin7]
MFITLLRSQYRFLDEVRIGFGMRAEIEAVADELRQSLVLLRGHL